MSEQSDARSRWYRGEAVSGILYGLNDSVQVTGSPNAGELGAVISLEGLDPEPAYRVELGSGLDLMLPQRQLRPVQSQGYRG